MSPPDMDEYGKSHWNVNHLNFAFNTPENAHLHLCRFLIWWVLKNHAIFVVEKMGHLKIETLKKH